jgi:branched-chain amino acid transport system permease protein
VFVAWALIDPSLRAQFLTGAGLAKGALIAAIALGVVLTYRGSGVVNFANGAIAMFIAYVYAVLRRDGDLFLPPLPNPLALVEGIVNQFRDEGDFLHLPRWPTEISFGDPMSFWPALIISLLYCVALGLVLHLLIFRPLRNAPPLAKVVASIGLFLLLPAIVLRRFTSQPFTVATMPFFKPGEQISLPFAIKMSKEQFMIAVLVIVFTILLWAVFQLTRFGLATRAAAENEKGALVLGFSPDFLAGANWVISTVITGLLGILAASVQKTVDPATIPALIVPALTAALVGSFTSFGWTTFAAFVLGLQFQLIAYLGITYSWFPQSGTAPFPGMSEVLTFLVIVVVLFLRGRSLPTRGAITSGRLPFSPTPPAWAVRFGGPALAVGGAIAGLFIFSYAFRDALTNTLVGVIICLSIVVITGFVGQISLAQMAFAGISAFLVSKLSTEHGWPFPWPIFVGAAVATVVGVAVALPALRVRGVNLAIVTLAFAVAVDQAIFKNPSVNGGLNLAPVKVPKLIDQNRGTTYKIFGFLTAGDGKQPNPMTAIFVLIVAVLLCYAVLNIRRSATGRRMLATRSNERAAAAAGVNVSGTKILAFAVSACIAGIGGAVIAYRFGNVTPDKFDYSKSLIFFAFAYLGGIASVSGAIFGGLLVAGGLSFTFLQNVLHVPPEFTLILGGLGLIFTAVQNPEGIAGAVRQARERAVRRRRSRAPSQPEAAAEPPPEPALTGSGGDA